MADVGSEKVTIYSIAKEAGVSPATVSRVLNGSQPVSGDKRSRVEEIIRLHNYRPSAIARSLTGQDTRVLGFIQPDIAHPYYNSIFVAAEQKAMELGYTFFLGNTLNDNLRHINNMEAHYLRLMKEKHVDGVLVAGGRINDATPTGDYVAEFGAFKSHTPIVTVSGHLPWTDCPSVTSDNRKGIFLMVNYLASLKHERIGFLGGARGIEPTMTRLRTFREALTEHGLEYREEWHVEGGFGVEEGRTAMEELLQLREKPTAILCFNDLTAIGAIFVAHKYGLDVPGDISIAGIDNIPFSQYVHPPITTVDLRGPEQGRIAVEMLVDILHGTDGMTERVLEPRLAVRGSCASP